ncbi:succinate dehydrogenase subunit [Trypanosoma cruzi]|nr:succinate dehydrogenase subunit [Trypanosoma cruzi]
MRRFVPIVSGGSSLLLRFVASAAVMRKVPLAKSSAKLGTPVTKEEVSQVFNVPAAILEQLHRPAEILFTEVDLARVRFAPLIATLGAEEDVTKIEAEVKTAKAAAAAAARTPVAGAKEKFKNTAWKSVTELVTFYEEVMLPARLAHQEYTVYELKSFHIKDDLKRGLSAFKQDHLDKQKAELAKVQKQMQECQEFIKGIGKSAFDTAIFNDLANILRVCGECNPYAHRLSMRVLEDMNLLGVPFNDVTTKLLHAIVFNDGALDDSALMFTLVEYPERGEVSVSREPVDRIADSALKIISVRHQTPLDDGVKLRQGDTQPCLQRSAE